YLTHPRYGVEKTYLVLVEGRPGEWVDQLTGGVELDDGMAAARRARVVDTLKGRTMVGIVMIEGRKREIRGMCSSLGHEVVRLVRTAIGPISDRQLKPVTWRRLEPEEVGALYAAASF